MKLEAPKNFNYTATVVRIKNLVPLTNCDNLVGLSFFGLQAIVDKSTKVGDIGVVFPSECQLGEEYCRLNNLYRHADRNEDADHSGYLEDNRRVRAIKLRGNRSDALFMPLSSLKFAASDIMLAELKEGDVFDTLSDKEICRKYVTPTRYRPGQPKGKRKESRVDSKLFPEHFDSMHWQRLADQFSPDSNLIVTQKLHGTSIRIGNVLVKRKLKLRERLARKLGVEVHEYEYANVYGSRKVIKDANNADQIHYYDTDLWSEEGHKLDGLIPCNMVIYGELIGWVDGGKQIQKNYTYDCLPGTRRLYVYRISMVNQDGFIVDLSWDAIMAFCDQVNLNCVPELWRGKKSDFKVEDFLDKKFQDTYHNAVHLSNQSPCDEGVCIRMEGIIPEIYKAKSPVFLGHETAMLDKGSEDIEEAQTINDAG